MTPTPGAARAAPALELAHRRALGGPSSPTGTPTAQGDPAVMEADSQQHLFYLWTDNNIWHVFYDENAHALHHEQWSGPGSITGAGTVYFLWKRFS